MGLNTCHIVGDYMWKVYVWKMAANPYKGSCWVDLVSHVLLSGRMVLILFMDAYCKQHIKGIYTESALTSELVEKSLKGQLLKVKQLK